VPPWTEQSQNARSHGGPDRASFYSPTTGWDPRAKREGRTERGKGEGGAGETTAIESGDGGGINGAPLGGGRGKRVARIKGEGGGGQNEGVVARGGWLEEAR